MKRLLLLACVLWGCGGHEDGSSGYLRGTWVQEGVTARIRLWDFGDRLEGWTDDGRRVSGDWPRLVLNETVWLRESPGVYRNGSIEARMAVSK